MELLNLWPLIFIIFIPILILLYLLKKQTESIYVPSTFLWDEVLKDIEVNTPWEKLKKNILLLLQLITLILFIFSMTNPFLKLKGSGFDNTVIVIDNTGSMNTIFNGKTRLDEALKRAESVIIDSKSGGNISLIVSNFDSKVLVSSSNDKNEVINKLKSIKSTPFTGDINNSYSLIKSMTSIYNNYHCIVYTDENMDLKDINGTVENLWTKTNNVSLDYMSNELDGNNLKAIVRITNRSESSTQRDISIYGDNNLIDVKTIDLNEGESKTVYFEMENKFKTLKSEISESDDLIDDNVVYNVIKSTEKKKVLLVTNKNVFLEKALSTIDNIDIYKVSTIEDIPKDEKYDLYIYDGINSEDIEGNSIYINPEDNEIFKINGTFEGGEASSLQSSITKYVENLTFHVKEFKVIDQTGYEPIFKINDNIIAFKGEYKSMKFMVFSFDLHNSDLVLKSEFPILIHNAVNELLESVLVSGNSFYGGESVKLSGDLKGSDLKIFNPDGNEEVIPLTFPLKDYTNTYKTGIYYAEQTVNENTVKDYFAVNFPSQTESNTVNEGGNSENISSNEFITGKNIQLILLSAILLFLIIEWIVYLRK